MKKIQPFTRAKEKKVLYTIYCLLSTMILLSLSSLQTSAKTPEQQEFFVPIFGPPYAPTEDIDGELFPDTLDEMIKRLTDKVPHLIYMESITKGKGKNRNTKINQPFLYTKTSEEALELFFALSELFPENIACDTETLIVAYQISNKKLSASDLYTFLLARAQVQENTPISNFHPYHTCYYKMSSVVGKPVYNKNRRLLLLNNLIPDINNQAIIAVKGHIGVIARAGETAYLASSWSPTRGIFTTPFHYPGSWEYLEKCWSNMKVDFYVTLDKIESNPLMKDLPRLKKSKNRLEKESYPKESLEGDDAEISITSDLTASSTSSTPEQHKDTVDSFESLCKFIYNKLYSLYNYFIQNNI